MGLHLDHVKRPKKYENQIDSSSLVNEDVRASPVPGRCDIPHSQGLMDQLSFLLKIKKGIAHLQETRL